MDTPVELLRIILRFAVHVEGALVSSISNDDSLNQWFCSRYDAGQRYKRSMINKRTYLFVSRAWHHVAVELLYEDIRIQTVHSMESLYKSLINSSKRSGVDGETPQGTRSPHGWWTRRFDLSPTYRATARTCFELFPAVAVHIPNLEILRFGEYFTSPIPTFIFPHLRYASISSDHLNAFNFEHIRSLSLFLTRGMGGVLDYPDLTFLELHISSARSDLSFLNRVSLPRLLHFSARYVSSAATYVEGFLAPFLERHGSQLTSLCLGSMESITRVNALLQSTPHIELLVLSSSLTWRELQCEAPVTRMGLFHLSLVVDLSGLTLAQLPKLEAIQLVDTAMFAHSHPQDKRVEISCPELVKKVKVIDVYGKDMLAVHQ